MSSMMFPHSITLIKKNDYSVSYIKGVYWSNSKTQSLNSKEMVKGNSTSIILPLNKDVFDVGDMLIKGEVSLPSITSVSQLEDYDYVTVVSKSIHDVGSNIDNVVLTCQ